MPSPRLSPRKQPSQKRSDDLVKAILEAAIRICMTKGKNFTTIEISEAAGISVGSLYQYFPNKESILFALHKIEWQKTRERVSAELIKMHTSISDKIVAAIDIFLKSENEELPLKRALHESDALFKQTPDFKKLKDRSIRELAFFLRMESGQAWSRKQSQLLAELIIFQTTSLSDFLNDPSRTQKDLIFLVECFKISIIGLVLPKMKTAKA